MPTKRIMVLAGITTVLVEGVLNGLVKPWGRRRLAEGVDGAMRPIAEAAALV